MSDLNNPDIRHALLSERLDPGGPLVAAALAQEMGVSVDTIRRDLIALERRGLVRRVRGGAIATARPLPAYATRAAAPESGLDRLAARAARLVGADATLLLDAGTTMDAVAASLPDAFAGLVVTPAPSVALAALGRGARVHLIGGPLSPEGAMATGGAAERAVAAVGADLCLLGACGLTAEFGLGAEDAGEAGMKAAMAAAADRTAVVAGASKFDRRPRHRVLPPDALDMLVTTADRAVTAPFAAAGVEVLDA